jgi:hypothetical protein
MNILKDKIFPLWGFLGKNKTLQKFPFVCFNVSSSFCVQSYRTFYLRLNGKPQVHKHHFHKTSIYLSFRCKKKSIDKIFINVFEKKFCYFNKLIFKSTYFSYGFTSSSSKEFKTFIRLFMIWSSRIEGFTRNWK